MAWSYEEFDEHIANYWGAANARGDKLLKVFFTFFGTAALIIVLLVYCVITKPVAFGGIMVLMVAFGILAAYIVITSAKFHRVNGVFCPHCGKSLISLGEVLEDLAEDGIEYPDKLECPKCHNTVVSKKS